MPNAAKPIELPEDLQAFAEERVRVGEFASVNEVAAEGLRLLKERAKRHDQVHEELGQIFGEMENGQYIEPTDEEFARAVHERALNHMAE